MDPYDDDRSNVSITFRKLRSSGAIRKQVRESYIRNDTHCVISDCKVCNAVSRSGSWLSSEIHIVIPSLSVFSDYIDLFETREITNVVVCHTAWRELQFATGGIHRRLKRLLDDPRCRFVVFPNEFFQPTRVNRSAGQAWNDWCESLTAKASEWYASHTSTEVIYLGNESAVKQYIEVWKPELTDLYQTLTAAKYAQDEESLLDTRFEKMSLYDKFWSAEAVDIGKKAGTVVTGALNVDKFNTTEGFVAGTNIHTFNRAVHGDIVAVSEGRVVSILSREGRGIVCTLNEGHNNLFVPMDIRIPKIKVLSKKDCAGMRAVIRIDGWNEDSRYPHGHFVRGIGPVGDFNVETEALMIEYGMDTHYPYQGTLLRSLNDLLPEWGWKPTESPQYRDLRDRRVFSMDPLGSMDIDDTFHIKKLESGYECGVHIAHVSHFVTSGSPLDIEARARSTTLYLVDRRRDMLPAVLSEDVCSLRSGIDRLAVSVIWTLNSDWEITDTWFGESIIHSIHSLHYQEAQDILESDGGGQLKTDIQMLSQLAKAWTSKRIEQGAPELEGAELRFQLSGSDPVGVLPRQKLEVNTMVAELMIGANVSVAKFIHECFPHASLLRVHGAPPDLQEDLVADVLRGKGLVVDTKSNKGLQKSLQRAQNVLQDDAMVLVKTLAAMNMSEAQYVCSGSAERIHHYGLAVPIYTHFTSPIRRYADIVVHRLLLAGVKGTAAGLSGDDIDNIVDHVNEQHRNSKRLQRASQELFLGLYLQKHTHTSIAIVYRVHSDSAEVFLVQYGVRGRVALENVAVKLLDKVVVKLDVKESPYRTPRLTMQLLDVCDGEETPIVDVPIEDEIVLPKVAAEAPGMYSTFEDFNAIGHSNLFTIS